MEKFALEAKIFFNERGHPGGTGWPQIYVRLKIDLTTGQSAVKAHWHG